MIGTSLHMSCHIRKLLIPETIPVYQSRVRKMPTHLMNRPKKDKCCQGVAPGTKHLFAVTVRP